METTPRPEGDFRDATRARLERNSPRDLNSLRSDEAQCARRRAEPPEEPEPRDPVRRPRYE